MSEPTGTKRRRTGARTSSTTTSRDEASQGPSLSRLNSLIAEAVEMAKLVKPTMNGEYVAESLRYESHKRLLETSVKGLKKHIDNDPIDGWEEQGKMAEEIGNSIIEWLVPIWQKLVEEDVDLGAIEKCLVVCSRAIDGMIDLSDSEPTATVTDVEGNISLSQAVTWIWRELLVMAASRKQPTKSILENIKRYDLIDEVYALIRKGKEKRSPDGYAFWDAHWTDGMKEAAAKIRLARR
ncbi:hypothetical protein D9613_008274 [Agrocybe pediades]|uniref:Uncharacterized protein n=1 Tax=Agrocybe pediades TaxID=84607 RepID=A0A8H4QU49_9AGAR|nr:hypothetical protein D9613_008274 [Agrocybe pediades]